MPGMEPLTVRLAALAGVALGAVWRAAPGLIAVGLIAAGAWMAYRPAGPLVAGALLLADQVADRMPRRRGSP